MQTTIISKQTNHDQDRGSEGFSEVPHVLFRGLIMLSRSSEPLVLALAPTPLGRGDDTLETLIELKFLNSSFSSFSPIEIRQTVLISSDSSRQHLNQQYPPPLSHTVGPTPAQDLEDGLAQYARTTSPAKAEGEAAAEAAEAKLARLLLAAQLGGRGGRQAGH